MDDFLEILVFWLVMLSGPAFWLGAILEINFGTSNLSVLLTTFGFLLSLPTAGFTAVAWPFLWYYILIKK